jgi:alpha-1,2-mannosyltransferase
VARYKRVLEAGVFVEMPLIAVGWLAWFAYGHGGGGDFAIFRRAGSSVLHGHSPYVHPTATLLASNDRFVYPTPFALPFVPFSGIPERVAELVFLALSVAAVLGALWLLGVRDRRCYGAAFLGIPVFGALGVGSLGPFLLLLVAAGWRYRDRKVAGIPLALAAATKLFLWPMLVWLVVTRRWRAAAVAGLTLAVTFLIWLAIDPTGMSGYPETLRVLNEVQRWKSYSLQSFVISLGASASVGEAVSVAVALLGIVAIAVVARRRGGRQAFAVTLVIAVISTPILWLHYLILLLVPIALTRPTLTPLWFVPVLLWVTPHPESLGAAWRIAVVLSAIGVVGAASLADGRRGPKALVVNSDLVAKTRAMSLAARGTTSI